MPESPALSRLWRVLNLERGLAIALGALIGGVALIAAAFLEWRAKDYGALDYAHTMRLVIPGVTLTALAFQTLLSSFFVSMLGMARR